ncbi:hypothetical protein [Streptomyces sp. 840.1]|uniref:hypothetical protein n=1 Tax=Streptomyces sp. 840.1 TaxID=2485152 RepID=UPI000F4A0ED4|nr:hypothetical protein [Streptomyces sp. 840.1]
MTAPQAQALAGRPPVAPAPARASSGTVPVVRPRAATPTSPRPATGGPGRAGPRIQRDVAGAGDGLPPNGSVSHSPASNSPAPGSPASSGPVSNGTPAGPEPERSGKAPAAVGRDAAGHAGLPQGSGAELDELARRLLDPLARLLRTELRRGRDRTGRPYDGRR